MVPQQAPRQLRRRIRRSPKSAVAAANNSLSAQAQPSSESLENSVDTRGHNTRPASSVKSAKVHNLCCTSSAGRAARWYELHPAPVADIAAWLQPYRSPGQGTSASHRASSGGSRTPPRSVRSADGAGADRAVAHAGGDRAAPRWPHQARLRRSVARSGRFCRASRPVN